MKTKHKEIKKRTADPRDMYNKYTAERVVKSWEEDFVDEDTGETVSIERNEIIMRKGEYLDSEAVQRLQFSIQAKEINDVLVSNQKRAGE